MGWNTALALLFTLGLSAGSAAGAEHRLTLDDAVRLALQRNEGLSIERESLAAAKAAVSGAKGAYDPVLGLDGAWGRSSEPARRRTRSDPSSSRRKAASLCGSFCPRAGPFRCGRGAPGRRPRIHFLFCRPPTVRV